VEERAQVEQYLQQHLEGRVHLVSANPLTESTRAAPWRLDVEVGGSPSAYVLWLDSRGMDHEYEVLRAMEAVPIPTPRAYGWDPEGEALGVPSFFCDFVEGESLLAYMLAGETWAEELYIDTVCALQAVTREQLASVAHRFSQGETAADWLEMVYGHFQVSPSALADAVYERLRETMPPLLEPRFSNGDLWPDNLLVRDRRLAGVIDFEGAGFTDPIYEFLLPFFLRPELRDRGLEERYCQRMGFNASSLPWYHALEYFDTWGWTLRSGESFEQHTEASCRAALERWLVEG
jgi:aminoglycoside phosphotransferase (APT) family kinase protein